MDNYQEYLVRQIESIEKKTELLSKEMNVLIELHVRMQKLLEETLGEEDEKSI